MTTPISNAHNNGPLRVLLQGCTDEEREAVASVLGERAELLDQGEECLGEANVLMTWLDAKPDTVRLDRSASYWQRNLPAIRIALCPLEDPRTLLWAVNRGQAEIILPRPCPPAELERALDRALDLGAKRQRSSSSLNDRIDKLMAQLAQMETQLDHQAEELSLAHSRLREYQSEMLQLELQGSITQLVRGLAHEFNNPLTAILGHAQRLKRNPEDTAKIPHRADVILGEVERCITLVERLRNYAAPTTESLGPCRLESAVRGAIARLQQRNVPIPTIHRDELPTALAGQRTLARVLEQVFDNAQHAGAENIYLEARKDSDRIHLVVDNDGETISDEALRNGMRPFFTTRSDAGFSGLGLSLASSMLRDMGGAITLDKRPDSQGTRVTVSVPAAVPFEATPLGNRILARARPQILIVDDDAMVTEMLSDMLAEHGCQSEVVSTAAAALERVAAGGITGVICNVSLPDARGGELLAQLLADSNTKLHGHLALITENPSEGTVQRAARKLDCPLLVKPLNTRKLQMVLELII